jgi:hypothetical protein
LAICVRTARAARAPSDPGHHGDQVQHDHGAGVLAGVQGMNQQDAITAVDGRGRHV